MQTYLKTKPVGVQLLLFIGMAFGLFSVFSYAGVMLITRTTGISMAELQDFNTWNRSNPNFIIAIRGMLFIQFLSLFLIPSLLYAYFSDPNPKSYLGLRKPSSAIYWILGILALTLSLPFVEFIGSLNQKLASGEWVPQWMRSSEEEAGKQIRFMIEKRTIGEYVQNLFFIAVLAGVGEELFFRGILQRLFIRLTGNAWIGIIIAATLFSAFHFQFFGFFPRLFLGILLGAVYWFSGSLWTAILAHFFYDALMVTIIYMNPELASNPNATLVQPSMMIAGALISAALTFFIVRLMVKKSVTRYEEVYAEEEIPEDKPYI